MAKEHITTVMENLRKALRSNRGLSRKIKRTYPCVEEFAETGADEMDNVE